jgi:hypothetical protein
MKKTERRQFISATLLTQANFDLLRREVMRLITEGYDIIEISGMRFDNDEQTNL